MLKRKPISENQKRLKLVEFSIWGVEVFSLCDCKTELLVFSAMDACNIKKW